DEGPRVSVVHVLAPHAPWRLTPDLRVTPQSPEISTKNPDDEDGVRDTYQAFLHQLAATDRVVAEMIDDLKASGRWDDTLLVVSADHGISFRASQPQRHTDFSDMGQSDDIFRVPLFVKYPGQRAGETSDCPVSNLDIVPTIVDVTDTQTSWQFDGVSLAGPCPTDRVREVRSATGETAVMSEDFQAVVARVGVYDEMVDADGPVERVVAVGRSAALIGTQMPKTVVDDRVVSWTLTQRKSFDAVAGSRGTSAPGQVTGTIELSRPLPSGTEGILAVSGRAAAVLGELSGAEGTVKFTAILDHRALTPGPHTVQLWVRTPDGSLSRAPD
ncbi:MAG: sulfatase-like hydrolase/transferase, partial [Ilumatobacteraceae bacterium]